MSNKLDELKRFVHWQLKTLSDWKHFLVWRWFWRDFKICINTCDLWRWCYDEVNPETDEEKEEEEEKKNCNCNNETERAKRQQQISFFLLLFAWIAFVVGKPLK